MTNVWAHEATHVTRDGRQLKLVYLGSETRVYDLYCGEWALVATNSYELI